MYERTVKHKLSDTSLVFIFVFRNVTEIIDMIDFFDYKNMIENKYFDFVVSFPEKEKNSEETEFLKKYGFSESDRENNSSIKNTFFKINEESYFRKDLFYITTIDYFMKFHPEIDKTIHETVHNRKKQYYINLYFKHDLPIYNMKIPNNAGSMKFLSKKAYDFLDISLLNFITNPDNAIMCFLDYESSGKIEMEFPYGNYFLSRGLEENNHHIEIIPNYFGYFKKCRIVYVPKKEKNLLAVKSVIKNNKEANCGYDLYGYSQNNTIIKELFIPDKEPIFFFYISLM